MILVYDYINYFMFISSWELSVFLLPLILLSMGDVCTFCSTYKRICFANIRRKNENLLFLGGNLEKSEWGCFEELFD